MGNFYVTSVLDLDDEDDVVRVMHLLQRDLIGADSGIKTEPVHKILLEQAHLDTMMATNYQLLLEEKVGSPRSNLVPVDRGDASHVFMAV